MSLSIRPATHWMIVRQRRFGGDRAVNRHTDRNGGIAPYGPFHPALVPSMTMNQGNVLAAHAARLQLSDQIGLGELGARHYQQAGCILIKTMNNAGTRYAVQLGIAIQQPIK